MSIPPPDCGAACFCIEGGVAAFLDAHNLDNELGQLGVSKATSGCLSEKRATALACLEFAWSPEWRISSEGSPGVQVTPGR